MEPRDMAIAQARGRIAVGIALLLAPRLGARGWIGSLAREPGAKVVIRGLAARDLALGLGIVIAIDRGAPVRGWLEAAALADAVDFLATLMAGDALPAAGRATVLAVASGSAGMAAYLARKIDSEGEPLAGMTPEAAVTGHPTEQTG